MFTLSRPTDDFIRSYLAQQGNERFSYDAPGCTANGAPPAQPGWNVDRCRVRIGAGAETFTRAQAAIRAWQMFPAEVATVCWSTCAIAAGELVAIVYRAWPFGCWILFPARIVYVLDDTIETPSGPVQRFGFGYGTLPDHPERGEERFLVEWNRDDDSVWYDLLAVSRPGHWLARLGYPYTRREQARFRRLSTAAMQRLGSSNTRSAPR